MGAADSAGVAMGAIDTGVASWAGGSAAFKGFTDVGNELGNIMLRAAARNVVTQGLGVITGAQEHFDWKSVAVSAIAAPIISKVSSTVGTALGGGDVGRFVGSMAGTIAAGAVRQLVYGGKAEYASIAADAFGNALGDSFVDTQVAKSMSQQQAKLEEAREQVQYIEGGKSGDTQSASRSAENVLANNSIAGTMSDASPPNAHSLSAPIGVQLVPQGSLPLPATPEEGLLASAKAIAESNAAYLSTIRDLARAGKATGAQIEAAGMLLRDNYGYQLGLDSGTVDELRGGTNVLWAQGENRAQYGVLPAMDLFLAAQSSDPTQNSERYQLFTEGAVVRDVGGSLQRIEVNFTDDSARLAAFMGISTMEARAKVDWKVYDTMLEAAFATGVNGGFANERVISLKINGAWRPKYDAFESYFMKSNEGALAGLPQNDPRRSALMNAAMDASNIGGQWSKEHSNGTALDINGINGIVVNSSGQGSQPAIVKQFSYALADSGASKVLQPWMVRGVSPRPNLYPGEAVMQNLGYQYKIPNNTWRSRLGHADHLHFLVQ